MISLPFLAPSLILPSSLPPFLTPALFFPFLPFLLPHSLSTSFLRSLPFLSSDPGLSLDPEDSPWILQNRCFNDLEEQQGRKEGGGSGGPRERHH